MPLPASASPAVAAVPFLGSVAAVGALYVWCAARAPGRWPRGRTACFLAGLVAFAADLDPWAGADAERLLATHVAEHMALWTVVAPLLVAGAPIRLTLRTLARPERRALARLLHSRPLRAVTRPLVAVALFDAFVIAMHVPAVYRLALDHEALHAVEHMLSLTVAMLMWAPLIAADPVPHRANGRGHLLCFAACTAPMLLIAWWLGAGADAVYGCGGTSCAAAVADQHRGAAIMVLGCVPMLGVSLALLRRDRRRRERRASARARALARPALAGGPLTSESRPVGE